RDRRLRLGSGRRARELRGRGRAGGVPRRAGVAGRRAGGVGREASALQTEALTSAASAVTMPRSAMANLLTRIFGSANERTLKRLWPIVHDINDLEASLEDLPDAAFPEKTAELRARLASEEATLDDLVPEAFALVREAARRTIGLRHFDVQCIGGLVLHQGKIAEMKTGEGKTLVATLPLYLNALEGRGAHLVTVNDYLARRDVQWMGPIYHFLGL